MTLASPFGNADNDRVKLALAVLSILLGSFVVLFAASVDAATAPSFFCFDLFATGPEANARLFSAYSRVIEIYRSAVGEDRFFEFASNAISRREYYAFPEATSDVSRLLSQIESAKNGGEFDQEVRKYLEKILEDAGRTVKAVETSIRESERATPFRVLKSHEKSVNDFVIDLPNGRAISGGNDLWVRIWDLKTDQVVKTLTGHTSGIGHIQVSPDFRRAFSVSFDGTAIIWDLESGTPIRSIPGESIVASRVRMPKVSPDFKQVLNLNVKGELQLWDLDPLHEPRKFPVVTHTVQDFKTNSDFTQAVSFGASGEAITWDLRSGAVLSQVQLTVNDMWGVFGNYEVSPDLSRVLIARMMGKSLLMVDLKTGKELFRMPPISKLFRDVRANPEFTRAISTTTDGELAYWNLETQTLVHTFPGHFDADRSFDISPDFKYLVSGGAYDGKVILWELETGKLRHLLIFDRSGVNAVRFGEDGKWIFDSTKGGDVVFWDLDKVSNWGF